MHWLIAKQERLRHGGSIARDPKRIANEDADMKTDIRKSKDANKTLQ